MPSVSQSEPQGASRAQGEIAREGNARTSLPAAPRGLGALAAAAGRGGVPAAAADLIALQRSVGNRALARSLAARHAARPRGARAPSAARPARRVLARQSTSQDVMMGMMWDRMG
jgi:hypothetical protein